VIGDRSVAVFYDAIMLSHNPDVELPFLPGRLDKRIRTILQGLNAKWSYPEHPGRLKAIREMLQENPIDGVCFETGTEATRIQLARVHTFPTWMTSFPWTGSGPGWIRTQRLFRRAVSRRRRRPRAMRLRPWRLWLPVKRRAPSRWYDRPGTMPNLFVPAVFACSIMLPWRRLTPRRN